MVLTCAMPINARAGGVASRDVATRAAGRVRCRRGRASPSAPARAPPPAKTAAAAASTSALGPLYTETLTLIAHVRPGDRDQRRARRAPRPAARGAPATRDRARRADERRRAADLGRPEPERGADAAAVRRGDADRDRNQPAPSASPSDRRAAHVGSAPTPASPRPPDRPAVGIGSPPAASTRAALIAAEKTAQANATTACLTAPADRVAVLASIAACRATHVAALA